MLMREAAKEYKWNLNYGDIALIWRGGCIIRSGFLGKIKEAFDKNPKLDNLLLDEYFKGVIERPPGLLAARGRRRPSSWACPCRPSRPRWRSSTATAAQRLPANLLQAQRDYFGAHTYERVDKPRGECSTPTGPARAATSLPAPTQRRVAQPSGCVGTDTA